MFGADLNEEMIGSAIGEVLLQCLLWADGTRLFERSAAELSYMVHTHSKTPQA